jgi:uncharacterized protein involved in exopolysaccharide biosynthesis
MKRGIRAAAWLYPKSWRERYGDEFEALIEDSRADFRSLADVLRGAVKMQFSRWGLGGIAVGTMLAGAAIGGVIAYRMPNQYVSRTTLSVSAMHRVGPGQFMPEADPVTNQHMGEVAVRRTIASVESFENLGQIINEFDLYGVRWSAPSAELIEQMKRAIVIEPSPGHDPTFALRFEYANRLIAQRVTQNLVSRMIEANLHLAMEEADSGLASRMELIDPPTLPKSPVGPNRWKITGEGLLIGLCGGILLGLVEQMRRKPPHGGAGLPAGEPVS